MFTIIAIASLVLLAGGFSLYIRRAARSSKPADREIPPRSFDGLFVTPGAASVPGESGIDTPSYRKAKLIERARGGDRDALSEASRVGDGELYQGVLEAFIDSTSNNRDALRALVTHISGSSELRGNKQLAQFVIEEWKEGADAVSTGEMAHVAALSDDAETYEQAVDLIVSYWKAGRLPQLSAEQLIEIVESQYWILSHEARHGGEGFALKIKFVNLRRELAAATRVR